MSAAGPSAGSGPKGGTATPFAAIPEIVNGRAQFTRVQALSLAIHVVVLVLLIVPAVPMLLLTAPTQAKSGPWVGTKLMSPFPRRAANAVAPHGGGSGGERDVQPVTAGRLPPFDRMQLAPPSAHPPNNARLAVMPTLEGPPALHLASPNLPNWGDPTAHILNDSNGPGHRGGMGDGEGKGIGPGDGPGYGPGKDGGAGDSVYNAGEGGVGYPVCAYCPNPQFSDEAVKSKYQGSVYLSVVVMPDGRATNIRVEKGLGMGLDERAVEAVRQWRFKPALGPDRKPVAAAMTIELTFRLY